MILKDEFKSACTAVITATDDGSFGEQGPVTLPLKKIAGQGRLRPVLACGPKAMLKAVFELCALHHVPCQVSMEERMGCGIGACLVCACKTKKDGKEECAMSARTDRFPC
jgi:dihydroorotate dehydrogenase electron transfer subunit